MMLLNRVVLTLAIVFLTACVNQKGKVLEGPSQLDIRNMQTRSFDTSDKNIVTRNVISTLQDLSFVIDKADADLGTVSATKLSGYQTKMTVTVRNKSENSVVVRASAQYNLKPIENPKIYQDFFSLLSKSLFLSANAIE